MSKSPEETILYLYQNNLEVTDDLAKELDPSHNENSQLIEKLFLKNSSISDKGFEHLLRHKPKYISIENCPRLTFESWINILKNGENVETLEISGDEYSLSDQNIEINMSSQINYLPCLSTLVLKGLSLRSTYAISQMSELCKLDLSGCYFKDFDLNSLRNLQNLKSLILFDVDPCGIESGWSTICELRSLRNLDISQSTEYQFNYPDEMIERILENLSNIECLDVSNTNLYW